MINAKQEFLDQPDIRNEGYHAAKVGIKSSSNPYSKDDVCNFEEWKSGWMEFNDEFSNN